MCATGCCSALQVINVCFIRALETTAAPLSATLITATTTASAHTIQANLQSAGNKIFLYCVFLYCSQNILQVLVGFLFVC